MSSLYGSKFRGIERLDADTDSVETCLVNPFEPPGCHILGVGLDGGFQERAARYFSQQRVH